MRCARGEDLGCRILCVHTLLIPVGTAVPIWHLFTWTFFRSLALARLTFLPLLFPQGYSAIHVSVSDPLHVAADALGRSASESGDVFLSSAASTSSSALSTPLTSFNKLGGRGYRYSLQLRRNMAASGLNLPTPIQQHTVPVINAGASKGVAVLDRGLCLPYKCLVSSQLENAGRHPSPPSVFSE